MRMIALAPMLLASPAAAQTAPVLAEFLDGHFRVVIGPDGKPVNTRPYSRSCLNMTPPKLPGGAKPVGLFVTHLLDPVSTELHVFTSYAAGLPLFVGTRDGRVWSVTGSRITLSKTKAPSPPVDG
jgi:hypothetical protein